MVVGLIEKVSNRPRPPITGECRALCRTVPMRWVPGESYWSRLEEVPGAVATTEDATVRIDALGLHIFPAAGGEMRRISFEGWSLYHVFERGGDTLIATSAPGYPGPLPTRGPIPDFAIVLVYSVQSSGAPGSERERPVYLPAPLKLHLVALDAAGGVDRQAIADFYALMSRALDEYREEEARMNEPY